MKNDIYKIQGRLSHSNEFDTLRLILSCFVVYIHAQYLMETPEVLNFGQIPAVPIFIFLSGFLVSESFYYSSSIFIYLKKRVKRILPAYFTVVIIGGLSFYIINSFTINNYETNLFSLLKYYFFSFIFLDTQYPCIHTIPAGMSYQDCAVNASLYTIKYELFFYSLIPIIFYFAKYIKYFFQFLAILSLTILSFYRNIYIPFPKLILLLSFLSGVGISMSRRYWINIFKEKKISSLTRLILVLVITSLSGGYIPLFIVLPLLTIICLFPTKNPERDFNAIIGKAR